MKEYDYEIVNVFTNDPAGGNPLAVITDARGISDTAMHEIAVKFDFSEITFILPPKDPNNTARVRIFTPQEEFPFAGHPNVGTTYVLGSQGKAIDKPVGETMVFEEIAGLIDAKLERQGGRVVKAGIAAPKALSIGDEVAVADLAACTALAEKNFITSTHHPHFVSVGLPFVVARLDSLDSLREIKPQTQVLSDVCAEYAQPDNRFSMFLYVLTECGTLRTRMIDNNGREDCATGSASGALAAYLTHINSARDLQNRITIKQGIEIGRPSEINVDVTKSSGVIGRVLISGPCVSIRSGKLKIDGSTIAL